MAELMTKIDTFVSDNVSGLFSFHDAEEKKEVEKVVAQKLFEFISANRMDIIPPGFVFWPTDSILNNISELNNDRSIQIIPEFNIYEIHPQQVPGSLKPLGLMSWFCFTHLEKKTQRIDIGNGHWKELRGKNQKKLGDGNTVEGRYLGFFESNTPDTLTVWRIF